MFTDLTSGKDEPAGQTPVDIDMMPMRDKTWPSSLLIACLCKVTLLFCLQLAKSLALCQQT
jgi:hypothetical protein